MSLFSTPESSQPVVSSATSPRSIEVRIDWARNLIVNFAHQQPPSQQRLQRVPGPLDDLAARFGFTDSQTDVMWLLFCHAVDPVLHQVIGDPVLGVRVDALRYLIENGRSAAKLLSTLGIAVDVKPNHVVLAPSLVRRQPANVSSANAKRFLVQVSQRVTCQSASDFVVAHSRIG